MSEKQDTDSIRISQVMAGALAAVTAALLGSTMGVAGTVAGAGVASVVSTVGGALYLRSLQRTGESVRSVRNRVVARAGSTTVAVVEEPDQATGEETEETEEQPSAKKRIGWPAVLVGSVLAFVLGMAVITGVEWLRGEPLSGGEGTTVGGLVRTHPDGADEREEVPPPATESSTTPPTTGSSTGTTTPTPPPTSEDEEPTDPPSGSSTPGTPPPTTTTGPAPTGSATAPPDGGAG